MKICFPWEMSRTKERRSKYRFGNANRQMVAEKLYQLGYDLEKWQKVQKPDKVLILVATDILNKVEAMERRDEVPFLFALSNSGTLLSNLAEVVPITYSLSNEGKSCFILDNSKLMDMLIHRRSADPYYEDSDEYVDYFDRARWATILFWEDIAFPVPGLDKFAGRIATLLRLRAKEKLPTVFTYEYGGREFKAKNMERIYAEVTSSLGEKISQQIEKQSRPCSYKQKELPKRKFEELEL